MDVQESKWIHNLLNGSMDKICFHSPRVITFLVCFFKSPLPIKVKIPQNMHVNYPGNKTKKTLKTTKSLKDPQVMPCCLNAQNLKFPKQPLSLSYGYPQMPCKKNSPVKYQFLLGWINIKSSKINLNPRVSQSLMIKSNPTFHHHHV